MNLITFFFFYIRGLKPEWRMFFVANFVRLTSVLKELFIYPCIYTLPFYKQPVYKQAALAF